jgi:hypothetical protein
MYHYFNIVRINYFKVYYYHTERVKFEIFFKLTYLSNFIYETQ